MSPLTPTSTDTDTGTAAGTDTRRFGRTVAASLAVLLVAACALTVAISRQPPRVASAQLDTAAAIERAGALLFLTPNQAWRADDLTVTVSPSVAATVSARGSGLVVEFTERLTPSTSYRVRVGPVTGRYTGRTGDLEHVFETPGLPLIVLDRSGTYDDGEQDRIVDVSTAGEDRVLFEHENIVEFAAVGTSVIASTLDEGVPQLWLVTPDGTVDRELPLPAGVSTVQQLRAEPTTGLIGYVTDPGDGGGGALHLQPIDSPAAASPVQTQNGEEVRVVQWLFVPGTAAVVVGDEDLGFQLIDPSTPESKPRPLGTYETLAGFVPGSQTLAVPDNADYGLVLLDLSDGTTVRLPYVADVSAERRAAPLQALSLTADTVLGVEWTIDPAGSVYDLVLIGEDGRDEVYTTEPGATLDLSVCLSPDGGHAAAIGPVGSEVDGYPVRPGLTETTVHLVDLETGSARVVVGSQPHWCSSGPTWPGSRFAE